MDDQESAQGPSDEEYSPGVRLIVLNLPEDEGEGLGFRLTRTLWDPYPWVREVTADSRADIAGLKTGDCILQADGRDLLGLPIGQVAGLIRGDGGGRGVSLLVWNCGVDPKDDPELLWSCGGGARGERARRALSGAVRALACSVCAATATRPLCCQRSHLYCHACWSRLERCALCRETLPPKDSPYARNLVAEQVFEAIAKEYEIKNVKKPTETCSAYASPNRSPTVPRRGQYQLSLMNRKKVQFDRFGQNYASDPNIHRTSNQEFKTTNLTRNQHGYVQMESKRQFSNNIMVSTQSTSNLELNKDVNRDLREKSSNLKPTNSVENSLPGNSKCTSTCQRSQYKNVQNAESIQVNLDKCLLIPHKVVATLRQACSMADLQNGVQTSLTSKSLNNLGECKGHHSSLDNLKTQCCTGCEPVFLVSSPPIYVLSCDHNKEE